MYQSSPPFYIEQEVSRILHSPLAPRLASLPTESTLTCLLRDTSARAAPPALGVISPSRLPSGPSTTFLHERSPDPPLGGSLLV